MRRAVLGATVALAMLPSSLADAQKQAAAPAPVYHLRAYSDCRGPGAAHKTLPIGTRIALTASQRRLTVTRRPGWPEGQEHRRGHASVFSGPSNGIATRSYTARFANGMQGGFWLLRSPNGIVTLQRQTDWGPATWLGHRQFDLTAAAASEHGYSYGGFPTDQGAWSGTYLGAKRPPGMALGRVRLTALGICGLHRVVSFRVLDA